MLRIPILFLTVLVFRITSASESPVPLSGTRVWITCFHPITTTNETFADFAMRLGPPEIPSYMALGWQTNYDLFGKHLISAAEEARLDSRSLERILPVIRSDSTNLAMLPVLAISALSDGEPIWIVGLYWERMPLEYGRLYNFYWYTFTQKTLRLVSKSHSG